ncbi:condensin complex subunit 1-like isoform X2 [Dermacentor albipictus]|uniref:condensin complex subunit 1-like isoform X2 n=1 Tax=Dermacentor albipictus TaxID=60249 RepID=UPI0031FD998E
MANFEFVLPLTKDQLLRSESVGQYYVKDVVPAREIGAQVRGFLSKKRLLDTKCVVDSFDLLYSVITNFRSVDETVIQDAFDLALLGVSKVESDLTILLQDSDAALDFDAKKQAQNHLKMSCYVLCHLIDLIEAEASKPSSDVAVSASKGRKKVTANNMKFLEWGSQKLKAVQCLKNIHELSLQCLWSPQPVEDEYINLVADCFFKLIEDTGNIKSSTIKDAFTTVIALNIKRHSYAIGCVMKIMQVLQAHEHVASFLAEALLVFSEKFGVKSIVGDCIRELCRLDSLENAQDVGGIRNLATFLVELTDRMPELVTKSAGLLVDLLNVKSYTMRIGVLTVFFKIVLDVLSKEGLDNKEKELRDTLLDHLEEHILDENAFVRGKVLQLWQDMCNRKCIPLDRQQAVLELITNRLCDKSSVVRKHAVSFVSAYLASNPFLAKLSPDELRKNLAEEEEKLQALRILHKDDGEDEAEENEADSSWMGILPGLQDVLQEGDEKDKDMSLTEEESVVLDEILNKIRVLLKDGSCAEAVAVLKKAIATYPDVNLFCNPTADEEGSDENKSEENGVKDNTDPVLLNVLKKIYQGTKVAVPDTPASDKETASPDPPPNDAGSGEGVVELYKQKMLVLYLKDCTDFAEKIQAMIPTLCEMLYSRTQSDIQEAIAFFVSAHRLGIRGATVGIRKMLPLVWSREQSIREAVANSYRDVYFNQPCTNAKTRARNIADGLSELVNVVTTSELICLEQLVTELVKTGDISSMVLRFLWERYTMEQADSSREDCLAATQLLSMVASADSNMVTKNLELLVSVGLGERGKADLDFCRHTCSIIQKMGGTHLAEKAPLQRFENSHSMFVQLQDILLETFTDTSLTVWIPTMERALDVIYKYAMQPAEIAYTILHGLAERLLPRCQQCAAVNGVAEAKPQDSQNLQEENGEVAVEESPQTPLFECSSLLLSRTLACVGQVALRQLIYLDVDVFAQLKRKREAVKDRKEQVAKRKKRQSFSATGHVLTQSQEAADSQNADDEMLGPVTDDTDAEYIVHLLDDVLLSEENCLGTWSKLVVHVVTEQSTYTDEGVRTVASLALAKLMSINAQFCEQHLALLFDIMENSPDPVIRTNLVVAVGDLMVRFPNLLHTWTEKIYARLQDPSRDVKMGTLKTVSFLILNDMIKVKGQISDIAAMVMDKDAELADMCRNFFFELGSKGNALYNLLPDIISHLSDEEHGIDENNFHVVMKLLFSCISKDKQLENFVEKLCFRFMLMTTERHWRDLAYCLSLIPFGERGIKKLHENMVCFADKMHVDAVYESITGIISNAKKAQVMKADVKVILEELEDLVEELRNKGLTESELVQRTKKRSTQASATKRGGKQSCATPRNQKTPAQGKRKCRKKMSRLSESSDDDEEEQASPPPSTRKALPRRQCKVQIQFSDSSEAEMGDDEVNAINPDTEGSTGAATPPDSGKTPFLSPTHDFIRGRQHRISTKASALVMDLQAIHKAAQQEAAYTWTPERLRPLLRIRSRARESTRHPHEYTLTTLLPSSCHTALLKGVET